MKRIFYLSLCLVLSSCVAVKNPFTQQEEPQVSVLEKSNVSAIQALLKARNGTLDSFDSSPYVRLPDPAMIVVDHGDEPSNLAVEKVKFTANQIDENGTHTFEMISLATDPFGRRGLSNEKIVYNVSTPTDQEKAAIKKSMSDSAKALRRVKDKELQRITKAIAKDFQTDQGLDADGIVGNQTIGAIMQDMTILDIKEISSQIAYSKEIEFEAFIIEENAVSADVLSSGIEGLAEVRAKALSFETLKASAVAGKSYIVCIYFFDRITPANPYKWGITDISKGFARIKSEPFYAKPGGWPIIIEKVSFNKPLESEKLFITVFSESNNMLKWLQAIGTKEIP